VEYRSQIGEEDPEAEPFRSRYAAAAAQERLLERCDEFEARADELELQVHGCTISYHTIKARLLMRHGLALAETDLTADSRAALERAADRFAMAPVGAQDVVGRVVVLNSLGMLLNNLGEYTAALPHLEAALELYAAVKRGEASTACSQSLAQMERDEGDAARVLEEMHTKTLYFLAQVHQNAGNSDEAAKFCAATLQRQAAAIGASQSAHAPTVVAKCLWSSRCAMQQRGVNLVEHLWFCSPSRFCMRLCSDVKRRPFVCVAGTANQEGSFSFDEWVTNAASLAGVFVSRLDFPCAEQLLHAASAVIRLGEVRCSTP